MQTVARRACASDATAKKTRTTIVVSLLWSSLAKRRDLVRQHEHRFGLPGIHLSIQHNPLNGPHRRHPPIVCRRATTTLTMASRWTRRRPFAPPLLPHSLRRDGRADFGLRYRGMVYRKCRFPDFHCALVIRLRLLVLAHFKAYTSKSDVRTRSFRTLLPTFAFDDLHRTLGRGQVDARLQFTICICQVTTTSR